MSSSRTPRSLRPVYVWEGDGPTWDRLTHGMTPATPGNESITGDVVICNPSSGPGTDPSPAWRNRITQTMGRGVHCAGYVPVGYGAPDRVTAGIRACRTWRQFYGVDRIFLDEMPSNLFTVMARDGHIALIEALILMARRCASRKLDSSNSRLVIANPGVPVDKTFGGLLPTVDVWVTHEGKDVNGPSIDDIGHPPCAWLPGDRQAWMSYNDPDPARTIARCGELGWGWAYSSSDPAPRGNPWDGDVTT